MSRTEGRRSPSGCGFGTPQERGGSELRGNMLFWWLSDGLVWFSINPWGHRPGKQRGLIERPLFSMV